MRDLLACPGRVWQNKLTHGLARDEIRVSRVVFEYAARIGQEQDQDKLLRLIADLGRELLGDRCSIWMVDAAAVDPDHRGPRRGTHSHSRRNFTAWWGPASDPTRSSLLTTPATTRVFRGADERTRRDAQRALYAAGAYRVIGAYQALNKEGGFSQADVNLLHLACSYSARAIGRDSGTAP